MAIHHITQDMVKGQPKIIEVLPQVAKMIDKHIVMGMESGLTSIF
jgi:DNA polymerase III epsilon subunit-like protein